MFDIDAEIKNAWIRQLKEDWRTANYCHFKDRMDLPNIDFLYSGSIMGKWEGGVKRRLSISLTLITASPWQYVQEVLYHEMVHQYVDEILGIHGELPHGETFRRICYENGFDHRAGGDLQSWVEKKNKEISGSRDHKVLDKIQKLLALAQSNNPHEAELAMSKAQELLLKHNLSLLEIEADRKYVHKQIGEVGQKNPIKSLIGAIINRFFFVEALWVFGYDQYKNKRGRILEIYGIPENIEMAEYVHDYLHHISEKLWNDYKRQKKFSGNKHRRTYIYGLLNGFHQKLKTRNAENATGSLVWKGDPLLQDYYRRKNPRIQHATFRYSRSCRETYDSGMARGKNLVINKGIKAPSSGKVHLLEQRVKSLS